MECLDLFLHVLIRIIRLDADARFSERGDDLLRIRIVLGTNRNDAHLNRRHPERERALEVLNQDADEALEGAHDGTVNHDRRLEGAIRCNVLEVKVQRQLEVQLNGAHLPFASQAVPHLEVDLRAIEGTVALIDLIIPLAILLVEDALERSLRLIPDLNVAHEVIRTR